jgi:hypothetical protein
MCEECRRRSHAPAWSEITLLLTATVQPHAGLKGVVGNAAEREHAYISNLTYYLRTHPAIDRIVFAENSGWDLTKIASAAHGVNLHALVETCSVDGNRFLPEYAKGYGEAQLIDAAFSKSSLIGSRKYVAKMTGRHILRNITDVVTHARSPYSMLCDLRDHSLYDLTTLPGCGHHFDTRFFVACKDLYNEHYRRHYVNHSGGGYSIEGEFYTITKALERKERISCRFPVEPVYGGMSGDGKNYDGRREKTKRTLRRLIRCLLRDLRV